MIPEESDNVVNEGKEVGELAESCPGAPQGKAIKKKKPRRTAAKSKAENQKVEVAPILREAVAASNMSYVLATKKIPEVSVEITPEGKEPTFTQSPEAQKASGSESKSPAPSLTAQDKAERGSASLVLTAQDILTKSEKEIKELGSSKREANNLAKNLRIITAILLGKKKNKELSQALQTDKSFTSKQVKELEEQGLIKREGEGKDVSYEVDSWNVLKFLQSKVVLKWKKGDEEKDSGKDDNKKMDGETK